MVTDWLLILRDGLHWRLSSIIVSASSSHAICSGLPPKTQALRSPSSTSVGHLRLWVSHLQTERPPASALSRTAMLRVDPQLIALSLADIIHVNHFGRLWGDEPNISEGP